MKIKKVFSTVLAMFMVSTALPDVKTDISAAQPMRDISTMELVEDMGIGINLGNTMESAGDWIAQWGDGTPNSYETAWGSPTITEQMIQGYANEGFGVLRIPVAWSNMMADDGTYTINKQWMSRVTQIVDWTLDSGMYAIVNIHWDNGWVNNFPDNKDESMKRYEHMWTQIADNFKDYGDYLMFESQNEELGWDSMWNKWGGPSDKEGSYDLVNQINQKFVDVVRNSGGNNAKRHLLISGYNTGIDVTCDPLFKMPSDPADRMAISVHYYTPAGFAILETDADWGKATSTWGTTADYNELNGWMDMMKTNFYDKGIPVIIGEYGCPTKNKEPESVRRFLSSVCRAAYERGLCPVLWDTPGGHYDRETCKLSDTQLKAEYDKITGNKGNNTATTTTATTTQSQTTTRTTTSYVPSGNEKPMRDMSTADLVRDMGIGINLGNTFESCVDEASKGTDNDWIAKWGDGTANAYETAWGSPTITQEMIQGYANEGFGVLRIPVAWSNMMSEDGKYTISSEYMKRVTQVVDWTIDAGMYAIINIHWDGGWVEKLPENKAEVINRFTVMWEQIADNFRDYDDYLMFESQNEELGWNSVWNRWGGTTGKSESYGYVNEVNQTFVDVIRNSGGNNEKRHLLISGYNTDIELTCDAMFKMPNDPANRCAVSVHYYTPAGFCILEEDADWGKASSTWGTESDFAELENNMNKLKTTFVDKGIPVIIGEYGCAQKNKEEDSIRLFLTSVCKSAYEKNMCPVLWDITDFQYDRETCKLKDDKLRENYQNIIGKTADVMGDANCDGEVSLADAVIILQSIASPDKFGENGTDSNHITAQGAKNADVYERGSGLTPQDALQIQKYLSKLITSLN